MRIRDNIATRGWIGKGRLISFLYYQVARLASAWGQLGIGKHVELHHGARIAVNHRSRIKLEHSKIIVHGGTFRVGITHGYFDGSGQGVPPSACQLSLVNSDLHILGDVSLYPGCCIDVRDGKVTIGGNTLINGGTHILCKRSVSIGSDCHFAREVVVRDDDGHPHGPAGSEPLNTPDPVVIGDGCWIGQRAMVLKGVTLGTGTIVAAGAVVTHDVAAHALVAGIPARLVRENEIWRP
ncbi:MAG: acyltransferase [Bacteroidetes bacterium]|nr:acyltransferase [Bacteroidota bacterium]